MKRKKNTKKTTLLDCLCLKSTQNHPCTDLENSPLIKSVGGLVRAAPHFKADITLICSNIYAWHYNNPGQSCHLMFINWVCSLNLVVIASRVRIVTPPRLKRSNGLWWNWADRIVVCGCAILPKDCISTCTQILPAPLHMKVLLSWLSVNVLTTIPPCCLQPRCSVEKSLLKSFNDEVNTHHNVTSHETSPYVSQFTDY